MTFELTKELNELFFEWKKEVGPYFVEDGLMLKANDSINVEEAWCASKLKIMFFLKDQNQGSSVHWSEDSRLWIRNDIKTQNLKYPLFRNLANILYGLCYIGMADYQQVWYEELNGDSVKEHFNTFPFAFVEGKKEPGGAYISNKTLSEYLNRDSKYIKREIEILNPNIIVCCGSPLFDFAINLYGKDSLRKYGINGNLRYAEKNNTILLYSEHPSKRFMKAKSFYEVCMDLYRNFIKTNDGKEFYYSLK